MREFIELSGDSCASSFKDARFHRATMKAFPGIGLRYHEAARARGFLSPPATFQPLRVPLLQTTTLMSPRAFANGVDQETEPDAAIRPKNPGSPARGLCVMGWKEWPHITDPTGPQY